MRVRLTVIDPTGTGAPVDVVVCATTGTVLGQVRRELLGAVGRAVGGSPGLYADTRLLPDDAPLGRVPLIEGAVLTVGPAAGLTVRQGVLELHVVSGVGAGAVHRLVPGEQTLGRATEAAVRLDNPTVSRLHAVVAVGPDSVTVRDLCSTNGTGIEGAPVGTEAVLLAPAQLLAVGDATLALASPAHLGAAVNPDGAGHLEVNRPPRLLQSEPRVEIAFPIPPTDPARQRFPLIALLVPLALGPILFFVLGNPLLLLFMLMSPLLLAGSYLSDRLVRRSTVRRNRDEYDGELAAARRRLDAALLTEQALRRGRSPDLAELLLTVTAPRARLWERRRGDEDFLDLRIGTADDPARVVVTCAAANDDVGVPPVVARVPITLAMRSLGVLGLAGRRAPLEALARSVIGQLAGWHSPHDLDVVVLCDGSGASSWEWVAWLPHTNAWGHAEQPTPVNADPAHVRARVTGLVQLLERRAADSRGGHLEWSGPRTVVVLDGACALRSIPGVTRILDQGPSLGIHTVCLERDAVALPCECGATVELEGTIGVRALVTVRGAAGAIQVVTDLPTEAWAHRLARALAPLRDATPPELADLLPGQARLLDLLAIDGTDPAAIAIGWRTTPRSTRAVVGVGANGSVLALDLARDGPHALVAGTTGAGKSELLQTLVASLALVNRPDEMVFVLVDYKGGSAFRDCERLPHTVGLVTDLDSHLTERALVSLGAELRRRKSVLSDAGCKDVADYVLRGHHRRTPLPRLVLVIDEFATLAEELPQFVGGLVSIAQLGRSLGVHLVLATQRPAGVVSPDIKANTNLRIALRVTDAAESMDVIDAKDAALIGRATPGRAVARVGVGDLLDFQSARVGGHRPAGAVDQVRVHIQTRGRECGEAPVDPPADSTGPTDLAHIVDSCAAAAWEMAVPLVPSPWLPPMGDVLVLDDLPVSSDWLIPLGLCDIPARQSRACWGLDLERGSHLLVAGGALSGRTTVLRTLAGSVAKRYSADDVHLFGIDGASGALLTLTGLPHTGAVVARSELTRADRLLTKLLGEVVRRQELFGRCAITSIAEQRALRTCGPPLPYLVVLLDSWEGTAHAFEALDHGRPAETLLRLVREGSSVGLRMVITGDRTVLGARVGSLIADRLVLRLADRGDYTMAGIPARLVPEHLPPGRGLLPDPVVETQVALLGPDPSGQGQVAALATIAERAQARATSVPRERRALRVVALPSAVTSGSLAATAEQTASGLLWALVGVGGDEAACLGVDLAADGPAFVVAGPAGSGRSTALLTMGQSLIARGCTLLIITPRPSPVRELVGEPRVLGAYGSDDGPAVRGALSGRAGPLVVLVDDTESLHRGGTEDELVSWLRSGQTPLQALVLAGCCAELAGQFRGLATEARKNRLGLMLAPGGGIDSDLLGTRVPRGEELRPGRGVLVRRGTLANVQVALPR